MDEISNAELYRLFSVMQVEMAIFKKEQIRTDEKAEQALTGVTAMKIQNDNINSWVKEHKDWHEKLTNKGSDRNWGLWMVLIGILASSLISALSQIFGAK